MSSEGFLVTGAMGCIGAWVTRLLLREGTDVAIFDLSDDDRRLRLLLTDDELERIERIQGDITNLQQVLDAAEGRTHVVHLAALQVPLVRANPSLGAAVNVQGTVNVFEAVSEHGIHHLSFASSAAVYGHPSRYDDSIVDADAPRLPETLYGVFKVANEDTAKIYWTENRVPSVGLRPYTVYGPGRDVGVTAAPTLAVEAAVRGEAYHIGYGGTVSFNYARDVAQIFIDSARAEPHEADTYSIGGDIVGMGTFVATIQELTGFSRITFGDEPLPFPDGLDGSALARRLGDVPHTPFRDALAETVEFFRRQT